MDQGALAIERVQLVEDMDRVKRTVESDRLRAALLTSISHDLKTPLASVLGSASTLRDFSKALSDAEKADLLSTIIDESERLNRFIANLLDMTKLESGAIVPNTARHDLGEIVGSALRRAGKILARHKVRLELEADLPMLELDAVLFEQVLFNLLDNAAKYAPADTTISLKASRDKDSIALQIIDEGAGIPQAELENVFDKFYRVQKGDHVRAGTGLGLAISRGFVEAMHGTISGRQPHRSQRRGADHPAADPGGQASAGHRRMNAAPIKVLVIDDEPPIRKLLRMGLSTQGYDVLEASNGKIALEQLSQNPALIILDLGLPDIQGHDLLRMIRGRNDGVPIVVLSSRGDEAGKVQALDLGADDYLTKPFGMDELLARMRAALRHQLQVHGERPVFRSRRPLRRPGAPHRQGRRARHQTVAEGIRPAARAGAARRQGADPPLPAERTVERTDRRAISARLCPPAPAKDRGRSRAPALRADRNRHRLPAARAGLAPRRPARAARSVASDPAVPDTGGGHARLMQRHRA